CSGAHSRNRKVGQEIGNGKPLHEIQQRMQMVAEGINTTESAFALSQKYQVEMPIVREVHHVLFEGKSPREAVIDLMEMARGEEIPLEAGQVIKRT
ncbi:MAG: NAD(P)H-dependent glycerol-3-phosphate dehydrogenase, partial [Nitrospiria bacterium]